MSASTVSASISADGRWLQTDHRLHPAGIHHAIVPPVRLFLLLCRRSLSDSAAARQQHETLRRLSDDATTLQRLSNSSQVRGLEPACLSRRTQNGDKYLIWGSH